MGQYKKELIALKSAGMRKGGKPAKIGASVVSVPRYRKDSTLTVGKIKCIGNRIIVLKAK